MGLIDEILFISDKECSICKENSSEKYGICDECLEKLEILNEYYIHDEIDLSCNYILFYNNFTKNLLTRFKFLSEPFLYKSMGEIMYDYAERKKLFKDIDLIIPVPLHKYRKRARGYNQSELLAKKISELSGIEMKKDIIVKIKNTKEQNKISYNNRKTNLENSIKVIKPKFVQNKNIMIIDDFITTGATAKSVYDPISKFNPGKIIFLALTSGRVIN